MDYVVVTTDKDKRGVFAGFLAEDRSPDYVVLHEARMCVYWDKSIRGVVGLAATGPNNGCRISFPATSIKLFGVTSIMTCSEQAKEQWEKNLWN